MQHHPSTFGFLAFLQKVPWCGSRNKTVKSSLLPLQKTQLNGGPPEQSSEMLHYLKLPLSLAHYRSLTQDCLLCRNCVRGFNLQQTNTGQKYKYNFTFIRNNRI